VTLTIYGAVSSRARRAVWTAEEAGVPYAFVPISIRAGEQRRPEYLARNPNGRVPTMVDGNLTLFESGAIALHIAAKAPTSGLLPEHGTAAWSEVMQWMFWVVTELEQPLWSIGKHRFALPPKVRLEGMQATAEWEWARAAKVLAAALEGREFLVGDRWTVADIFAAQTLFWARGFGVPFGFDVLEQYTDRGLARPAFERTNSPTLA